MLEWHFRIARPRHGPLSSTSCFMIRIPSRALFCISSGMGQKKFRIPRARKTFNFIFGQRSDEAPIGPGMGWGSEFAVGITHGVVVIVIAGDECGPGCDNRRGMAHFEKGSGHDLDAASQFTSASSTMPSWRCTSRVSRHHPRV